MDVLARRTRLAFLNVRAAEESLPRVIELLSRELGWTKQQEQEEYARARRFLCLEMGLNLKDDRKSVPINFTKDDINLYMKRFRALDTDNKGYITITDLRSYFMVCSFFESVLFPFISVFFSFIFDTLLNLYFLLYFCLPVFVSFSFTSFLSVSVFLCYLFLSRCSFSPLVFFSFSFYTL